MSETPPYPCGGWHRGEPTYDGFEGGNRGELFIESEDEALPSMHLFDQIIKCDVSPMEARPRERARSRGHRRLSGGGRWRAVGRVQRGRRRGQEGVLRGDDGRGRGNMYILGTDWR